MADEAIDNLAADASSDKNQKPASLILPETYISEFDNGRLPLGIEHYLHKLPWPFSKDTINIYPAAFYGGPDLSIRERVHTGVDFHVSAGTPVLCIEDGQVVYGRDDERGFTFGDLIIEGKESKIIYRYCHLSLKSLPWDYTELWGEHRKRPTVKAGQKLGEVALWFKELCPEVQLPQEAERVFGRKQDHLHLETSYDPHGFLTGKSFYSPPVKFNPLLILQRPKDFFTN